MLLYFEHHLIHCHGRWCWIIDKALIVVRVNEPKYVHWFSNESFQKSGMNFDIKKRLLLDDLKRSDQRVDFCAFNVNLYIIGLSDAY